MDNPAVPADVQAAIDAHMAASDRAQAVGDHASRAKHASDALALLTQAWHPTPSAAPQTGVEAAARLAHLNKDPAWRDRFGAGDVAARREFDDLNKMVAEADPVSLALAGVAPTSSVDQNGGAVINERDLPAAAQHLRDMGLSEADTGEFLRGQLTADGKPLTAEEMAAGAEGA